MEKFNDFILVGVIAGVVALLDFIGVVGFPVGVFGVSGFYIGAAFFTAFALWFKRKGLLSLYIGLLIGAVFAGTFTIFAFMLALGNVIGSAVAMLIMKNMKADITLKKTRDYLWYLAAAVLQNIISAVWTIGGFRVFGMIPEEAVALAMFGWIVGGVIVSIIIGIPLLKIASPVIKRTALYQN